MLLPATDKKIEFVTHGISLPKVIYDMIDETRGDIPRSTYMRRVFEREFKKKK